MDSEDVSRILRNQAWERAKGEMRSMLPTFYGEKNSNDNQFEHFNERMDMFIKCVEDDGLSD